MYDFFGRYENLLDSKGRISLPAPFRRMIEKEIEDEEDKQFVVTKGTDRNIVVFPVSEWKKMVEKIKTNVPNGKQQRSLLRRIHFHSSIQKLDKQGRINIPTELIHYAELKKEVVVIGTGNKIEIWNPRNLSENIQEIEPVYLKNSDLLEF